MSLVMTSTSVLRSTVLRILRADLDDVFVNMIAVYMVQVAVVQVVRMTLRNDSSVSTAGAVLVAMRLVNAMFSSHEYFLSYHHATQPTFVKASEQFRAADGPIFS
jgi:hypothetical protein